MLGSDVVAAVTDVTLAAGSADIIPAVGAIVSLPGTAVAS
jgi:hypothetical protein